MVPPLSRLAKRTSHGPQFLFSNEQVTLCGKSHPRLLCGQRDSRKKQEKKNSAFIFLRDRSWASSVASRRLKLPLPLHPPIFPAAQALYDATDDNTLRLIAGFVEFRTSFFGRRRRPIVDIRSTFDRQSFFLRRRVLLRDRRAPRHPRSNGRRGAIAVLVLRVSQDGRDSGRGWAVSLFVARLPLLPSSRCAGSTTRRNRTPTRTKRLPPSFHPCATRWRSLRRAGAVNVTTTHAFASIQM